jgi:hypothetical protein
MFARGRLSIEPPLTVPVPWPNAPATFVAAGFTPKPHDTSESVPMCPAGLSLLMAIGLKVAGEWGVFLIVPLLGGLAVWCTYVVACRIEGPVAGAVAAVWIACSPIVLYQVVQPMSDIPAMAWWTAALASAVGRRHPMVAGLAASAAVMTRPNLAPLGVVVGVFLAFDPLPRSDEAAGGPAPVSPERPARGRIRSAGHRLVWFCLGLLPGVVAVAWLQNAMYGSPLQSGYGGLSVLFSLDHIAANLRRYPAWLYSAHGPIVLLAVISPFLGARRRDACLLVAFVAAVVAAYLPYVVFDDWSYLRFLLPGLPALLVLVSRVVTRGVTRLPIAWRPIVVALLVLAVGASWIHTARMRAVFQLAALEQKYPVTGDYVRNRLPANSLAFAGQESGSVRYYAARPSLAWDAFEPTSLDAAVGFLRQNGYDPFFVLEPREEERFRERFSDRNTLGALDWPPSAQIGTVVRIYRAGDRERYLKGESVPTTRIWLGPRVGR